MTILQEMQTREIVARAEGMDLLAKLYTKLNAEGRLDDWNRAMLDTSYRDKLLKEELAV